MSGEKKLVPKLRFPEFRGAEGWTERPIGEFLSESRLPGSKGNVAKKITVKLWGNGVFEKSDVIQGSINTQYFRRKAGQFIYSKLDFLNQAFGIIPPHLDNFESTVDLPCFDFAEGLHPVFLLEYVKRKDFYERLGETADGSRKARRIHAETFLSFPIALTSPAEQQKIADCLSSLDELIAAQARKVDALKTHKKGLMQQLFPREGETQPRLRFPEFRKGKAWDEKLMSEVYSFKGNNSLSRDKLNYKSGTIKNIHYGDIHTKFSTHFDITQEDVPYVNESDSPVNLKADNFCIEGDLIFADASEDMEDIGKVIEIIRTNGEQVVSGLHTILARQTKATLVTGFGAHLFKSIRIRSQIQKESQGAKVLGLAASRLAKIKLPFPSSTDEQQKIADCLSSLDELIAAQARKVDALKTHKKGLMQQLFPREGETQPRLRFPEFRDAGEWKTENLGSKTSKVGSGITPTGGDKNYKRSGRSFVRSQNVGWGELLLADVAFIDEETHKSFNATEIKSLDVLLNITGASIGRSAVADSRIAGGNVNQHVCIIRVKPAELNPFFLNQYLISSMGQEQIDSFQAGGNRQGLNFAQIRSFSISLPPNFPEQKRIAECLTSIDTLISDATQDLETLKTHKKGLMQQLFPSAEAVEA